MSTFIKSFFQKQKRKPDSDFLSEDKIAMTKKCKKCSKRTHIDDLKCPVCGGSDFLF
jgi:uncharacterized OB-fold protein